MIFNSLQFLVFFPLVLLLYFTLPKKLKWIMLLAASYYFYISWKWQLVFLILFTTAVSYICAILIEKTDNKKTKKLYITITLIVCFGVLFFFKYYNFLADSAASLINLFGGNTGDVSLDLLLPVGISFYTFQTLSYAIDVYRGTIKAERHFGWYALYVSYFPQLVAGPIERPENLLPQLRADHKLEAGNAFIGIQKMAVGFFKKIVVADLIAKYVNAVYNDAANATGAGIVIATILFAVQIYCDFAGYTDIAIGCAKIMGINLMQNFDRPYSARSIKDFWARWHISLTTWFRDYLYIPLGGNRCGKLRHMSNIFIVFLASGLWHGANWTFVAWGALHGAYQIIGHLTKKPRYALYRKIGINTESKLFGFFQRIFTFVLVCFAWIFFRANSISDLGILLSRLFTGWNVSDITGTLSSLGLNLSAIIITVLSILIMTELDILTNGKRDITSTSSRRTSIIYTVWAVAAAWIALLAVGGTSAFIYFQF